MRLGASSLLIAFVVSVALSTGPAATAATSYQVSPTLELVPRRGYLVAVAGRHWVPRSRITFIASMGRQVTGLEVRANGDGTFEIGLRHISLCDRDTYTARDFFDHEVRLSGPKLMCPVRLNPPIPILVIVKGIKPQMDVVPLIERGQSSLLVIKQGDAVYYWSSGWKHPSMVPRAPHRFFSLIERGTTPATTCPNLKCGKGYLWEWVGVTAGNTGITLSPWCVSKNGKVCPQDMVVLIPIRITSRLEPNARLTAQSLGEL